MNHKSSNKFIQRSLWMGALLLTAATASAATQLTFMVDMTAQINDSPQQFNPATDTVYITGSFNGWNTPPSPLATPLTNLSGNVYTATVTDTDDANGSTMNWKVYNTNANYVTANGNPYETPADYNNRAFALPAAGGTANVPYVYENDEGSNTAPITVTFSVNMGAQIALGNWVPANTVEVQGNWNGWAGDLMSNNPPGSTIYTVTIPIPDTANTNTENPRCGSTNAAIDYKFVVTNGYLSTINNGYESPSPANQDGGGNRWIYVNPIFGVLPTVYWSDVTAHREEYLTGTNCMVTFNVNMTGAVGTDGYVFGSDDILGGGTNVVCVNGVYGGTSPNWDGWGTDGAPWVASPLTGLTMSPSVANSNIWTITVPINSGNFEMLTYKYSINGWDDEAGENDNHTRWIRDTNMVFLGGSWIMPTDTFGSQGSTTSAELDFGNLTIAPSAGGVTLSWLGHNSIALQSAASVSGPWTTLANTDGTVLDCAQTTGTATINYNANQPATYYRLVDVSP